MSDTLTKEQRSYTMSRIRSRWTSPERKIHNILKGRKINHVMHPKISGSPDIIFPKSKIAVFIHGCFWHKCPKHYIAPKTRRKYWSEKIRKNATRDTEAVKKLKLNGWRVIRIWEHEIKKSDGINKLLPV